MHIGALCIFVNAGIKDVEKWSTIHLELDSGTVSSVEGSGNETDGRLNSSFGVGYAGLI